MKRFALSIFILFALGCCIASSSAADEPKTNILLITADDLGYEPIGFLGAAVKNVTPNLDKLASQSMSFEHAHVNAASALRVAVLSRRGAMVIIVGFSASIN